MRKFVFVFSILSICLVGALDRAVFDKMINDFSGNSYEDAVRTAISLGKDDNCIFENDSKFFLHEFFDCMAEENKQLEQFREEVSSLCSNMSEVKLGY
jgi:hypothetical protein